MIEFDPQIKATVKCTHCKRKEKFYNDYEHIAVPEYAASMKNKVVAQAEKSGWYIEVYEGTVFFCGAPVNETIIKEVLCSDCRKRHNV